jgi:hypothetical protein
MVAYDALFSEIEEYDMSVLYLEFSKIGKVMAHVAAIPSEVILREEFQFRARAKVMASRWHRIMENARRVRDLEDDLAASNSLDTEKGDGQAEDSVGGVVSMAGSSGGYAAALFSPASVEGLVSVSTWVRSQTFEAGLSNAQSVEHNSGMDFRGSRKNIF